MTLQQLKDDLELLGCRIEITYEGQPRLIPPARMEPAVRDQVMNLAVACRELRQEIIDDLAEHCPLCERIIRCGEDRDRLADPAFCNRGGAYKAAMDAHGVVHSPELRCPYKL